uniref:Beta-amylase n=1 Tax=Trepomonas sp. PC1 TaxID=1076344 RepID=A0A146K2U8_9EUKA|eukprot:JAP91230.1 Beta-amylase [Trepomonas sp. PC1]
MVKVNVMLPLTTVNNNGQVTDKNWLKNSFQRLKGIGVNGVMMDVWWGISEPNPGQYRFDGYREVFQLAKDAGLKAQPVMSFHKCGGNVGDDCNFPIPQWAHEIAISKRLYYEDQWGNKQEDYISLSADNEKIFPGPQGQRTPIQIYSDYMNAFKNAMGDLMSIVDDIQVGTGPCGETRYPGYPMNRWHYPGVGAFQAFDPLYVQQYKDKAQQQGKNYQYPPTNAGQYNSRPEQTEFFTRGFKTEEGNFFLQYYQQVMLEHSKTIILEAKKIFPSNQLSVKISGIHWWYGTENHAAELTCGYYNANGRNAYIDFMEEFGQMVTYDFTCLEMTNQEHSGENCNSQPEQLVQQVWEASKQLNTKLSGENALARYDYNAYQQILRQIRAAAGRFQAFTYLRLTGQLLDGGNFDQFRNFVQEANKI